MAPLALEQARAIENATEIDLGIDLVRLSVLSIVILAPLGAIIMMATGPILLKQITAEERESKRRLSYLRRVSLQPDIKQLNHRANRAQ